MYANDISVEAQCFVSREAHGNVYCTERYVYKQSIQTPHEGGVIMDRI